MSGAPLNCYSTHRAASGLIAGMAPRPRPPAPAAWSEESRTTRHGLGTRDGRATYRRVLRRRGRKGYKTVRCQCPPCPPRSAWPRPWDWEEPW